MQAAVEASGSTLMRIPGIGPVLAARLIARTGRAERFASSAAYANYCGAAPVQIASADNTIIDFLHAADGAHFSLAASGSLNSYGTVHALSPDGSGYLLLAGDVYSSIDGANWTDETSTLPVNTANWGTTRASATTARSWWPDGPRL